MLKEMSIKLSPQLSFGEELANSIT
ncbi:hemolysin III family protein, partial [Streptococcus suis]|nr:hemolysin III family protein [Streptococcus suis]